MTQSKILKEIMTWIGSAVIGIVIALFISIFIFQPTKIVGKSMHPTLKDTQRIYISKLPRLTKYTPQYGDIIIIDSRVDSPRTWRDDIKDSPLISFFTGGGDHHIWVKRVIGIAGDKIEYKKGRVWRNNKELNEPYLSEIMLFPFEETIVPDGTIFVMGDNRNYSKDSRQIGPVPVDHVLGKKIKVPFLE